MDQNTAGISALNEYVKIHENAGKRETEMPKLTKRVIDALTPEGSDFFVWDKGKLDQQGNCAIKPLR